MASIQVSGVSLDMGRKHVAVDEVAVHVTDREYRMLEYLMAHAGTTVTKEMLLKHLYGDKEWPDFKIIDVYVCKLRKKLTNASKSAEHPGGKQHIQTAWGRGYCFLADKEIPQVQEEVRRLAATITQIVELVAAFKTTVKDLGSIITSEETRTGLRNPQLRAYSILAKTSRERRDNLERSIDQLVGQLELFQRLLQEAQQTAEQSEQAECVVNR